MSDQPGAVDLIDEEETRREMGGMSVSSLYQDPELQALKFKMSAKGGAGKLARWDRREVRKLRDRGIAASRTQAEAVRLRVIEQNARRSAKRRLKASPESRL
jgi:leucyl aminopeptidase (aminopeptidase T)